MSDLVERLRKQELSNSLPDDDLCSGAADEIEQLEALLKVAKCPDPNCEDGVVQVFTGEVYQCQWCDERAALENKDE